MSEQIPLGYTLFAILAGPRRRAAPSGAPFHPRPDPRRLPDDVAC